MGMLEALQMILQVCNIIFNIVVVLLAIEGKEVAVQDDADAFQQARVDSLALEDVIHIGAVAVQLVSEPSHTTLLAVQFCLDFFADVYCHCFVTAPTADVVFLDNLLKINTPSWMNWARGGVFHLPERV